ncbi:hypothetical protein BGW80DRAFT_1162256 [Lactifluus volemus]|nr:hypothetical protein BGW80DRAFT_1162256 [Lactifluus volemus]
MSASETGSSNTKEWVLEPETEYRFELDLGTSLAIKVLKGHAEVFGAELADGRYYLFGHECKAAIFTWQGCTIEMIRYTPSTEYVSDETPMQAYANVHLALEKMRVRALTSYRGSPPPGPDMEIDPEPPRVLVLGPENSGKTTVCKILTNYSVRAGQGWTPMYVNTNPSEVCIPVLSTCRCSRSSRSVADRASNDQRPIGR